jgi:catechol 2,3-dioxygenase-like lactoylglutathione lyase family enzyme
VHFEVAGVVLGAADARELARFYEQLLGWARGADEDDWITLREPNRGTGLSFQTEVDHVPPVWPAQAGDQQMQLHLDIAVDDLERAVERATSLGARLAEFQPQEDVRVMLDPAGHPFCLFPDV